MGEGGGGAQFRHCKNTAKTMVGTIDSKGKQCMNSPGIKIDILNLSVVNKADQVELCRSKPAKF